MNKISENETSVVLPEFTLEYEAKFSALRSKDFQKLLEDVQKSATNTPLTESVLDASAVAVENPMEKVFAITLTIRTSSWFSGGELLNELVTKILTDAKIVQYDAYDTAFERFRKSQNERFVIPSGHSTKTLKEAA